MWKLYAILAAVFAALTAISAKVGVRGVSGNVATAVRTCVVLLLAWGIVIFGGQMKELRELSRFNVIFLLLSGVATGLSWIFYFKALETGDVSRVAPIDKLSVVFVMIIAFVFLGEPMTLKSAAGGLLITIGAVLLTL
ncbi:MAG: EamA family transporter [Rikenellaceae bacterium]|nr:EamA family transporter [Rikenellaceae bacterium]MCL2692378.1 EamA family transporter [Rikenellaceae bacterium]